MARRLLVLLVAVLVAVQVVRNSAVAALGRGSPDLAARIWSGHPETAISLAMTQIGRAARERRAVPAAVFDMIDEAAVKAPLAPEPFLVRGVQAQLAGEVGLSTSAFLAAERRDPRSLPAHYFLADRFFRSGDSQNGLREVAALARLAPGGVASLAPYVAAYAKDRSTWPQLRGIFASNSDLEYASLRALAADAANTDAAMALADKQHLDPKAAWAPALLGTLLQAGDYARARNVWAKLSGVRLAAGQTLFDPGFAAPGPPPPFNWELMSSTVGTAERQPGGRLHVIFYGQQDGLLARQLLLLQPGRYRLSMGISGNSAQAHALTWSIRCDRAQAPLGAITLDVAASRPLSFAVPAGCPAQWLELSGVSSDISQQSDFTISHLQLQPEGTNG